MTLAINEGRPGVCLVGFMGAGKTSVGRLLGERLGWRFVDLDDVIESQQQRTIADIFRTAGERAFRELEAAALRDLLSAATNKPMVIALGGGAFVQAENAGVLRQWGWPVVFLDASLTELHHRCMPRGAARPLFHDENQFRQLYEARRPGYMKAEFHVDTTGLTLEQVAEEVEKRLGLHRI